MAGFNEIPTYLIQYNAVKALEMIRIECEMEESIGYKAIKEVAGQPEDLLSMSDIKERENRIIELISPYEEGLDLLKERMLKQDFSDDMYIAALCYSNLVYGEDEIEELLVYKKIEKILKELKKDISKKIELTTADTLFSGKESENIVTENKAAELGGMFGGIAPHETGRGKKNAGVSPQNGLEELFERSSGKSEIEKSTEQLIKMQKELMNHISADDIFNWKL